MDISDQNMKLLLPLKLLLLLLWPAAVTVGILVEHRRKIYRYIYAVLNYCRYVYGGKWSNRGKKRAGKNPGTNFTLQPYIFLLLLGALWLALAS